MAGLEYPAAPVSMTVGGDLAFAFAFAFAIAVLVLRSVPGVALSVLMVPSPGLLRSSSSYGATYIYIDGRRYADMKDGVAAVGVLCLALATCILQHGTRKS